MAALMGLFAFLFIVFCAITVFALAAFALKMTFKLVLLPIKLLLLPFIAIAVIIKLAFLLALGAIVMAILIPIAILLAIVVGPFLLVSALT